MRGKKLQSTAAALLEMLDALPRTHRSAGQAENAGEAWAAGAAGATRQSSSGRGSRALAAQNAPAAYLHDLASDAPAAAAAAVGETLREIAAQDAPGTSVSVPLPGDRELFAGAAAPLPLYIDTVEEIDRCFRRDSRRYDGGFGGA